MCVQVTLLAPVLAAKQRELTYYRQRDGIVKSVGGLIRGCAGPHPDCMIAANTAKSSRAALFGCLRTRQMVTTSRYLEAPRRLRAFVRAHESSLVLLALLI